jgi:hypothetical protein
VTRLPYEVLVFVRRRHEILVLHRSPRQGSYWHSVAGAVELLHWPEPKELLRKL